MELDRTFDHSPTICVAVCTYMREQSLVETLQGLLSQERRPDHLLVLDQTPEHLKSTRDFLSTMDGREIEVIKLSAPNLPAARNVALKRTGCELVLFIDDDVIVSSDLVGAHLRNYGKQPIAAVAGRVEQDTWPPYTNRKWPRELDYRYLILNTKQRLEGVARFSGGNHSIVRESALALGGYDENYVGWGLCEDVDMALRVWRNGGTIIYDPDAWLQHLCLPTGGCEFPGEKKHVPEWQTSFPANYFLVKNFFPRAEFWSGIMFRNLRKFVLRKRNVMRPWTLPVAVLAYCYAIGRAFHIKKNFVSVLSPNNKENEKGGE